MKFLNGHLHVVVHEIERNSLNTRLKQNVFKEIKVKYMPIKQQKNNCCKRIKNDWIICENCKWQHDGIKSIGENENFAIQRNNKHTYRNTMNF